MTAVDSEDTGFLSRWSRRKTQVREGTATGSPGVAPSASPQPALTAAIAATATPPDSAALPTAATNSRVAIEPEPVAPAAAEALPTLADVATLTRDSDYSRFMAQSVQPDVKNAALAKLFSDPHFNVMDGLDVYIDDYGKPDPLPPGMLRQMFQSQVLGLFDDDEEDAAAKKHPPDGSAAQPPTAAPSHPEPPAELPAALTAELTAEAIPDENTDLQLQPDDGAGRCGPAPGAVENTGRAH